MRELANPPRPEEARRRDSRNLGTILWTILDNYVLTEGEVSDPDEVCGERKLSEAVGGREEVSPGDDDGAAPVEARVLAAHAHGGLPGVRAGAVIAGML